MLDLYLIHGRTRLDETLNDWGFNGPRLQGVEGIHGTYGHLRIHFTDAAAAETAEKLTGWERFDDNVLSLRMNEDCVEVRGFNGTDNQGNSLTDATVYFGDWGLMKSNAEQSPIATEDQPTSPRSAATASSSAEIDYLKTAESYGFVVIPWTEFLTKDDLPDGLMVRALDIQKDVNGSFVLYDPHDDADGFMLIGNDPVALAKAWDEQSLIKDVVYTYRI